MMVEEVVVKTSNRCRPTDRSDEDASILRIREANIAVWHMRVRATLGRA